MTIYLVVKTHNITGLKYLCKTERDPYKYKGSGKYWKKHLKIHGKDNIHTEIIKECSSHEELKYWGIYYSDIWNVVDAKDENGNKLWANLRPEEGDGLSSATAKILNNLPETKAKNSKSNKISQNKPEVKEKMLVAQKKAFELMNFSELMSNIQKNKWANPDYKKEQTRKLREKARTPESREKNSKAQLIAQNKPEVIQKQKEAHSGVKNPRYDHTIFKFVHKNGTIENCTRYELYTKYKLNDIGVLKLVKGQLKSTGGWKVEHK